MAGGGNTNQWMVWAFKLHGCVVCGVRYPELPMSEFHCNHIDPTTKNHSRGYRTNGVLDKGASVSDAVYHKGRQALLEELAKCEVVCAKHHRQRERDNLKADRQGTLFGGNGQAWIMRMLRAALPNSTAKGYHPKA